jgi:hypothetical protein
MNATDLCYTPATELSRLIRSKSRPAMAATSPRRSRRGGSAISISIHSYKTPVGSVSTRYKGGDPMDASGLKSSDIPGTPLVKTVDKTRCRARVITFVVGLHSSKPFQFRVNVRGEYAP